MARWVKSRTDKSDPGHMERVLNVTEQGGMNEVLTNLYALTGKAEYLATARRFDERHYTEPLTHGQDKLKGEHVNSFIPNIIGAAREYEMTGDPVLRDLDHVLLERGDRGPELRHRRHERQRSLGGRPLPALPRSSARRATSPAAPTTCSSSPGTSSAGRRRPEYADYYERALWNGILSTQNPGDGMMMYYVPMLPGMYRTFMKPFDSFWCCTGTGMENHAKYGDSIYFHDADGLFVNLFIASELDWTEKGVKVRQETRFPEEPKTTLTIGAAKPVATRPPHPHPRMGRRAIARSRSTARSSRLRPARRAT